MAEFEVSSLDNSFESKLKKEDVKNKKLKTIVKKENLVSTKESLGSKFRRAFISDDMKDVGSYIIFDWIIPGIKDGILSTIERMFYADGDGYSSRRRDRRDDRDRVSYASYYKSSYRSSERRDRDRDEHEEYRNKKVDYRNIVVDNKGDAEDIVIALRDCIHEYGSASIAQLLDCIGEVGTVNDNYYGWTREEDISWRRIRNGYYLIDVPKATYVGD